MELVWSHTRHTVTEHMQTSLAAPLTRDELTTALIALPRGPSSCILCEVLGAASDGYETGVSGDYRQRSYA